MKGTVTVAVCSHPDQRQPSLVMELPCPRWRAYRVSKLLRKYASHIEDPAVWLNGEDVTEQRLNKIRMQPGDKVLFCPRVGAWPGIVPIFTWLFTKVIVPAAIAYGVSYAAAELFGSDLPDSDDQPQGQSFGFNPRTVTEPGGVIPWAFGQNLHTGTVIAKWTDVDATGNSNEVLYMLVSFGEGPTEGIVSGGIYLNGRPITDYSGVTTGETKGTLNQACLTGFTKTKVEMRFNNKRITYSGGSIEVTLPRAGFDDIEFTLGFMDGIGNIRKSTGEWYTGYHWFKVEIAEVGGGYSTLFDSYISGNQRPALYKAYSVENDLSGTVDRTKQYKLRFTKTYADTTTRRVDNITLRSIRGVIDIAFKYPGEALLGIKAVATSDLQGDVQVEVERQDRICYWYNGSTWVFAYKEERAWGVYNALLQPCISGDGGGTAYAVEHVEGFTQAQLDTAFFQNWASVCDDLVDDGDGGTEMLIPLHHIFDQEGQLWETMHQICQIGRAHLVWTGSVLTGWVDKAWSDTSELITANQIEELSWRDSWASNKRPAGTINVWFQDAGKRYERMRQPVHNTSAGRWQNQASIEAIGFKSGGGADRVGKFALARNAKIRSNATFVMFKPAVKCLPGDVRSIQRNVPNWGHSYRVMRPINGKTIEVDRTVVGAAGDTVYVQGYDSTDGEVQTKSYTLAKIRGSKLTITGTFAPLPTFGNEVAVGSTTQIGKWRVKAIETLGDHRHEITVENYDATLWSGDSDTPALPYPGAAPLATHNVLSPPVQRADVSALVEALLLPGLSIDMPIPANITWNDDTPSAGSISWSATTAGDPLEVAYKGTVYEISASNTANKYVYWIPGNSTFATTDSDATMAAGLLSGYFVVAINNDGAAQQGQFFPLLWGGLIMAATIATGKIFVTSNTADADIVGNYPCQDAAASTTVVNTEGTDATLAGGDNTITISEAGHSGNCLRLDGSADYIQTGLTYQTTFRAAFTVGIRVKPDDGNPSADQLLIYTFDSTGEDSGFELRLLTSGKLWVLYTAEDTAGTVYARTLNAIFADGAASSFTHIGVVVDASQIHIYVDGIEQDLDATFDGDTSALTLSNYTSTDTVKIGASSIPDLYFDGCVEDVTIFDRALTDDEMATLAKVDTGDNLLLNHLFDPTYGTMLDGTMIRTDSVLARHISVANLAALNITVGTADIDNLAVKTAHIDNLNVTTGKIANSAITETYSTYTAGTFALSSSYQDVASVSVTVVSSPVQIDFACQFGSTTAGNTAVDIRAVRDTTTLRDSTGLSHGIEWKPWMQSVWDTPGAGTYTYKIQARESGAASTWVKERLIVSVEYKK